jgi:hypothetical protein
LLQAEGSIAGALDWVFVEEGGEAAEIKVDKDGKIRSE